MTEAWELRETLRRLPDTTVLESVVALYLAESRSTLFGRAWDTTGAEGRENASEWLVGTFLKALGQTEPTQRFEPRRIVIWKS